jgi:O-antigen/teichoic acid export membrane protein
VEDVEDPRLHSIGREHCDFQPVRHAQPSARTLIGIVLIVLLIVLWAGFVASLASVVGRWPVLVQAPFYLIMGTVWIIPLKPLVRWMTSGRSKRPIE